mgnify:FL=1
MVLFEMKNIKKSFGSLEVLKDISLQVEEGEVLSIIGPSGSGKSTLLRCATGLETPDSGEIIKQGDVGLVFQNFNLFPHFSVLKKHHRCSDQSAEEKERRGLCTGKNSVKADGTCRQRECISVSAFRRSAATCLYCQGIMYESEDPVF